MEVYLAISGLLNMIAAQMDASSKPEIAMYARLAGSLISTGSATVTELERLTDEVAGMVKEGRDPTPEEFSAIRRRRDELSAELRATAPIEGIPEDPEPGPADRPL